MGMIMDKVTNLLTKKFPYARPLIKRAMPFLFKGDVNGAFKEIEKHQDSRIAKARCIQHTFNWALITFLKINPCDWECICQRMIMPIIDQEFKFYVTVVNDAGKELQTMAQKNSYGPPSITEYEIMRKYPNPYASG